MESAPLLWTSGERSNLCGKFTWDDVRSSTFDIYQMILTRAERQDGRLQPTQRYGFIYDAIKVLFEGTVTYAFETSLVQLLL